MSVLIAIVSWIVFGFLVGLVARAVVPGTQALNFWATTALGIVGSVVGGLIASLVTRHELFMAHPAGFLGSILGAITVLFVATTAMVRRA
jgi:uncharacterized membrane protein YeaQ/YmgE (transglycosylase-associated protein family)